MGNDRRTNAISPKIDLDQVVSKVAEVSLARIAVSPSYWFGHVHIMYSLSLERAT